MPSTHDFTPTDHNEREQVSPTPPPVRSVDEALTRSTESFTRCSYWLSCPPATAPWTETASKGRWNAFKPGLTASLTLFDTFFAIFG